jgi:hypothetical protein
MKNKTYCQCFNSFFIGLKGLVKAGRNLPQVSKATFVKSLISFQKPHNSYKNYNIGRVYLQVHFWVEAYA